MKNNYRWAHNPLVFFGIELNDGYQASFGCLKFKMGSISQRRSQDVKSQDREETKMVNRQDREETETFHFSNSQDRDVPFSQTLKTETRRSTFKTEMRPRRCKKRLETAVSQFKNTNWWSLSLNDLFLAGQIHYFLPDISASLMHCMDVHKTKVTRPRPRRCIFKTEMRLRRWTLKTETRCSKKRLETETFKTETTSLVKVACGNFHKRRYADDDDDELLVLPETVCYL